MQTERGIKGAVKRNDIFVDSIIQACYDGNVNNHSLPLCFVISLLAYYQYSSQASTIHIEHYDCLRDKGGICPVSKLDGNMLIWVFSFF